jgi:hypothetical protein
MRDVNPSSGSQQYVLWTNPEERTALRVGFALLVIGSLVAGGVVGYAVGRKKRRAR